MKTSSYPCYLRTLLFSSGLLITTSLCQAEDRVWVGADHADWSAPTNWLEGDSPTLLDRTIYKQDSGGNEITFTEAAEAQSL